MTFTVTYRGKDGAKREECIDAASRAECLAECKRRGIAPSSIREGRALSRSGSGSAASSNMARSQVGKAAILAVTVLAVAGGAWWWLTARSANEPYQADTRKPDTQKHIPPVKRADTDERVSPAPKPTSVNATNEVKEVPLPPWNDSFMTNREMRLKYSTLFQATTNEGGLVIERYRLPNGKTWRKMIDPPPLFNNISDQAIAMVVGGAAGAPIPPVPGLDSANLDKAFAESLLTPIEISPDDPPRIAALKLAVKETREEIAAAIKAGDTRSVGEILNDHISLNNRQAELQAEALRAVDAVRDKDGEEAAAEFLKAVNGHLKSYGAAPITLGKRRVPVSSTQPPNAK